MPPPGLLTPSLYGGPQTPLRKALRWIKGLTLVCHHWRDTALPFLYREVLFQRVGQVFALADTMRLPYTDYSSMVYSVTFACYVPAKLRTAYTKSVVNILTRCSNLTALTFMPVYPDILNDQLDPAYSTTLDDCLISDIMRICGARLTAIFIILARLGPKYMVELLFVKRCDVTCVISSLSVQLTCLLTQVLNANPGLMPSFSSARRVVG